VQRRCRWSSNRKPNSEQSAPHLLWPVGQLSFEDRAVVTEALDIFRRRKAVEFSDCLMLQIARKAGHAPMATFDRDFAKLEGVERLG